MVVSALGTDEMGRIKQFQIQYCGVNQETQILSVCL